MDIKLLEQLLAEVKDGHLSVDHAVDRLRTLPFEDLGFARVDHHRQIAQGFPEVVFAEGKSLVQIRGILQSLTPRADHILVTRLDAEKAAALLPEFEQAQYHPDSRVLTLSRGSPGPGPGAGRGALRRHLRHPGGRRGPAHHRIMGHRAEPVYDVGVAGLHRLLAHQELLAQATVFVVVAGMEGALPSVVGGLVDRPVIAVPTSIGYGASFGGWRPCWPCSTPAPPGWRSSTSTTASAPVSWRR